eukprot:tig00000455_g1028.t1
MHAPHEEAPRATATLPHSIASPSAGSQSAPPQQPPPITFAPAHQQDPSPTYYPAAAPAQASYPPQQPPQQQQQQQAAPPAAAAAQPSAQPSPRFGRGAPPEAQNYPCVQWLFDVCSEPTRLAGGWLVTLVLCLYAWTYFTFVVVHCIWLVMPNLPGLAAFYLAVFHVVWPLVIVSYLRAVYSDPGCVPKSLPLTPAQQQEVTAARQAAANGEPLRGRRYCFKCDAPKPERTHHCSICNRCRMRFDHHCPWISNCVGYGNHKFFVLCAPAPAPPSFAFPPCAIPPHLRPAPGLGWARRNEGGKRGVGKRASSASASPRLQFTHTPRPAPPRPALPRPALLGIPFMFWTVVMCILIIAFTTQSLVMVIRHFIDGGRAGINEVGILVTL